VNRRRAALLAAVAAAVIVAVLIVWKRDSLANAATWLKTTLVDGVLVPASRDSLFPLYVLAAFLLAGATFISVWFVIVQVCLLSSPLVAVPLALGGALVSAAVFFAIGRLLSTSKPVAWMTKRVPPHVMAAFPRLGIDGVMVMRVLPVLPFTLVNVCAGAAGVRWSSFIIGTLAGMAPGVVAAALLGQQFIEVVKHPSPRSIAVAVAGLAAIVAGGMWIRRRARRFPKGTDAAPPDAC
jgi:phospholipase D1/2